MTDIWLWVNCATDNEPLDFRFAAPPAGEGWPDIKPKFKSDDNTVVGVDFGVIWATDFDNEFDRATPK